ncbi:sarcocystatin-A-like [Teleopsis dalmanni]|uniref:sarcocystatin-A-like n=1 Tax=Teleopsis dalmanni TaxID=139649 RepID=UPI0018CF6ECF|nr:sarcocystatin-A-like [Teleopsis dalmanni]
MFGKKILLLFSLFVLVAMAQSDKFVGGPEPLTGDDLKEAEELLATSLAEIAGGDVPRYIIVKVIRATRQVVAGTLYNINAELSDNQNNTKSCIVKIWTRPWIPNSTEVTLQCEGENEITKTY